MQRLVLPAFALALVSIACSAQSAAAPPTAAAPSPTPTVEASPTPTPDVRIQLSTLSQLRVRWAVSDPGKGSAMTYLQCASTACDTLTRIGAYAFSPDGTLLAFGACSGDPTENRMDPSSFHYVCPSGGEVRLYDSATGSPSETFSVGGFPRSLAFDPQGKVLAAGMSDGQIEVWDLAAKAQIGHMHHATTRSGVYALTFSGDASQLISQGDGKIQVWDWQHGTMLKSLAGWGIMSLDPSGQHLISGWYDPGVASVIVRIFDLVHLGQSRDVRPKFVQPNVMDQTITAAFIRDGQALLIMGSNGAEWWDAQGKSVQGHTDIMKLIADKKDAFSPQGAVTPDGLVLTEPGLGIALPGMPIPPMNLGGTSVCGFALWNPSSPGAYAVPTPAEGCQAAVVTGDSRRAVISPDGRWVAADDGAGQLRVWAVDPTAAAIPPTCLGKCPGS
jgi:WD40 repeat protein